jgi:enamine deaminase RidA (YjgF/YER057c/UK114 family)
MLRRHAPPTLRPPFANYAHAVGVPAGAALLFVSGQLGIAPDDAVPAGAEAQADLCFANVAAILADAGMSAADVVRINAFVTDRADLPAYMRARDRFVGVAPPPASTLMIVAGFARPEFKVEVEVVAARDVHGSA